MEGDGARSRPAIPGRVLGLAGALALASALLKLAVLLSDTLPFNSDEAVVALMARHILQGRWMAFFYGQAYLGSLDASLVALAFAVFGQRVEVIRWIQLLLYAGTVITSVLLTWRITRSMTASWVTGLLLAVPTVNITLYTTVSIGGYGEALLLGQSILLLTLALFERRRRPALYAAWGLLAGLAFWTFGLTLVYILPAAVGVIWHDLLDGDRRQRMVNWGLAVLGVALGMAPWLGWATVHSPSSLFTELLGSAIAGASPASLPQAWLEHARNLLLLGGSVILGFRPPWDTRWLGPPLLPFALAIWSAVFLHAVVILRNRDAARAGRWMIAGVAVTTIAGFVLTPFGADPSGRYFLPLALPMAFFAGSMAADLLPRIGRHWVSGGVALLLAYNLWGTVDSARRTPPGLTTQFDPVARVDTRAFGDLIAFLQANGEQAGYTNYWVAYPLAFLSEEQLIFVPRLPYHEDFRYTARDNRYPPYDAVVAESDRAAYITTNHPALDNLLRAEFTRLGIDFREATIGGFHVFYRLSNKVTPEMLGLPVEEQ